MIITKQKSSEIDPEKVKMALKEGEKTILDLQE